MSWYPCPTCCSAGGITGCYISNGWETIVKNSLSSSDITGWSINSGTWDGTQSWESGTTADAVKTTSSNAKITCDTQQSLPLDDRTNVVHWVKLTQASDEALIWMAGHKVLLTGSKVEVYDPSGNLLTSSPFGISINVEAFVHICTWYNSSTTKEYIGVFYYSGSSTETVVAETTLGTDGTTAFGTGTITGTVSFHHQNGDARRDGDFLHNTVRTDGTGKDCRSCFFNECTICPGGDSPRYLSVEVDKLATKPYGTCTNCVTVNATYVVDMYQAAYAGCERLPFRRIYVCYGVAVTAPWDRADYYVELSVRYVSVSSSVWKVEVIVEEWRDTGPYSPLVPPPDPIKTVKAVYKKEFSSTEYCPDIDDDLVLDSVEYPAGSSYVACDNYDSLDIHVTASQ